MKLRNKKTGEIGDIAQTSADCIIVYYPIVDGVAINPQKRAIYTSLDQLNAEWEDYEEPKGVWYLNSLGSIIENAFGNDGFRKELESIGNYFETKEEAEKAVEKLKAWKRLKDKGLNFSINKDEMKIAYNFNKRGAWATEVEPDLDLLFGGEK